jgi:hypothetical protein
MSLYLTQSLAAFQGTVFAAASTLLVAFLGTVCAAASTLLVKSLADRLSKPSGFPTKCDNHCSVPANMGAY